MAKVKLSQESYDELLADITTMRAQADVYFEKWQDAKRKAEAWDKLKAEKINDYKKYSNRLEEVWGFDYISRPIENYLGEMEIILQRMDELDGTNEFQNLLSDLEACNGQ